jgi:tyrosyl-tRNA synthetase
MFGKVMSIPDDLILTYFVHCTRVPMTDVDTIRERLATGANPRDEKLRLAKEIVKLYHGDAAADAAEKYFVETISEGKVPEQVTDINIARGLALVDAIAAAGFAESKGDARRKIEQGGVEIDGAKVTDTQTIIADVHEGKILKVGKHTFARIRLQ